MKIDIITLFPDMFNGPFDESIVKRAKDKSLVSISVHQLRDWGIDKRGTVDARPYGGGAGMLLRPEPIFDAVGQIKTQKKSKVVLLDAGGETYTQQKAQLYSTVDQLILVCGHYEGVDYRVHKHLVDDVISIGNYVLTGGEIPSMIIVDSVVRLIPGVLENEESIQDESFSNIEHNTNKPLVEYPQYTRPEHYKKYSVPEILLTGNHANIEKWRTEESEKRSKMDSV